jgi:hypothetical protein
MNREVHVRICEGLRGKFPRSTRPWNYFSLEQSIGNVISLTEFFE